MRAKAGVRSSTARALLGGDGEVINKFDENADGIVDNDEFIKGTYGAADYIASESPGVGEVTDWDKPQPWSTRDVFNTLEQDSTSILPDVVPSDRLESLRTTVDEIVDRERQRNSDWDANPIPRANIAELVDPSTADILEFSLGETTFGVSQRALDRPAESVALSQLLVLCNPEFEPAIHGATVAPTAVTAKLLWGADDDLAALKELHGSFDVAKSVAGTHSV